VRSGPGIRAPDRATINEVTGTPANIHRSMPLPALG
jgi:hypothetical protein